MRIFKIKTAREKRKFFVILPMIFALILAGTLFLTNFSKNFARAATTYVVSTEQEFADALASADTDIDIKVANDITITATKNIPAGKNVSISSVDPANPATIWRDANYGGNILFTDRTENLTSLTLADIILDGNKANMTAAVTSPLIYFQTRGNLSLENGAIIQNNSSTGTPGGISAHGYNSSNRLTFNLNGGIIRGNDSTYSFNGGGGIYASNAIINISDGAITGNSTILGGSGIWMGYLGDFTMTGGSIDNNIATGAYDSSGALKFEHTTATVSGGRISNNKGSFGIYDTVGKMTLENSGEISYNERGGVYIYIAVPALN